MKLYKYKLYYIYMKLYALECPEIYRYNDIKYIAV